MKKIIDFIALCVFITVLCACTTPGEKLEALSKKYVEKVEKAKTSEEAYALLEQYTTEKKDLLKGNQDYIPSKREREKIDENEKMIYSEILSLQVEEDFNEEETSPSDTTGI